MPEHAYAPALVGSSIAARACNEGCNNRPLAVRALPAEWLFATPAERGSTYIEQTIMCASRTLQPGEYRSHVHASSRDTPLQAG